MTNNAKKIWYAWVEFEGWVESTIKESVHKPEGMMRNVGPRLHPLKHHMGKEAAKMAWGHQQRKINQLKVDKHSLNSRLDAAHERIGELLREVEVGQ